MNRGKAFVLQAVAVLFAARVLAVASWNKIVVRNPATLARAVLVIEVKDFHPSEEEKVFLKQYLKKKISKVVFVSVQKKKIKVFLKDRKTTVLDLLKQGHREWQATGQ